MGSTGHVIRDAFFDSSQRLIAQLLLVQRQRCQGSAPGTPSRGQGFQNPRCNGGLSLRKSIHQVVELFSGYHLHGPNLAHPNRPDSRVLKFRLPHESLPNPAISGRAAFGFNGSRITKQPMAALSSEVTPMNARDPEGPTLPPLDYARAGREAKSPLFLSVPH